MNSLLLIAHPEPDSYNAQLRRIAMDVLARHGTVEVSDLYAQAFDPAERAAHYPRPLDPRRFDTQAEQRHACEQGSLPEDVAGELSRLRRADLLMLQFPLWWFGAPAMLKGWIDRVFVYGGMYSSRRRFDRGVCRGKRALLGVTVGSPAARCGADGIEGDTRVHLWPLLYSLRYVGFDVLEPLLLFGIHPPRADSDGAGQRRHLQQQADAYRRALEDLRQRPSIAFNAQDDWDASGCLRDGRRVLAPAWPHAAAPASGSTAA